MFKTVVVLFVLRKHYLAYFLGLLVTPSIWLLLIYCYTTFYRYEGLSTVWKLKIFLLRRNFSPCILVMKFLECWRDSTAAITADSDEEEILALSTSLRDDRGRPYSSADGMNENIIQAPSESENVTRYIEIVRPSQDDSLLRRKNDCHGNDKRWYHETSSLSPFFEWLRTFLGQFIHLQKRKDKVLRLFKTGHFWHFDEMETQTLWSVMR